MEMANIVIADGAATPVNHTFAPEQGNPPEWVDTLNTVPYKHLQFKIFSTFKKAASASGINRVKHSLVCPVGGDGVTVPANEVARYTVYNGEALLPSKGLKQERKDLRVLFKNLLADAHVIDNIDELRGSW